MDEEKNNQSEVQQPPPQPPIGVATAQPEPGPGQPPRTSGMAIASLVLGVLCLGLPGLILGIIALVQIGKNPTRLRGQGLALAGTIISAISLLFVPFIAAILFPVFARARDAAQETNCMNNLKQISIAVQMYTQDWDNAYPMAANWNEAIAPYTKNPKIMVCPKEDGTLPGYAMNAQMDGKKSADVAMPSETALIFESVPGVNQYGGPELFPTPARHRDKQNVGFADGHVTYISESGIGGLNFNPGPAFTPNPSQPPPAP